MDACRQFSLSTLSLLVLALAPMSSAWAQQVKVTAADPASTTQGTTSLDVTVSGSGFDNTAKPAFLVSGTTDPGGITVKKVVVQGPKKLIATIDVADTATVANFDIEVTLDSGRKGKGTTLFSVQKKTTVVDPCSSASPDYATNWAGFPAYAYVLRTPSGNSATYEIRIASRNGICSKRVGDIQSLQLGYPSFARTSDPSLPYVVAWYTYGSGERVIAKFSLVGATDTEIPAEVSLFRTYSGGSADLSPDGSSMAYAIGVSGHVELRVASLSDMDVTGSNDVVVHVYESNDISSLSWAPWGRIYFKTLDVTNGRRLMSVDPNLSPADQSPETLLQMPANPTFEVNKLWEFAGISTGYAGYDSGGMVPNVVFEGLYAVSVKRGGSSGNGCRAAYAIDARTHAFLVGSPTSPSPITGFYPSVTGDSTVLIAKSTVPTSGSNCSRSGYIGEGSLAIGYSTFITDQVPGVWPAALKTP